MTAEDVALLLLRFGDYLTATLPELVHLERPPLAEAVTRFMAVHPEAWQEDVEQARIKRWEADLLADYEMLKRQRDDLVSVCIDRIGGDYPMCRICLAPGYSGRIFHRPGCRYVETMKGQELVDRRNQQLHDHLSGQLRRKDDPDGA